MVLTVFSKNSLLVNKHIFSNKVTKYGNVTQQKQWCTVMVYVGLGGTGGEGQGGMGRRKFFDSHYSVEKSNCFVIFVNLVMFGRDATFTTMDVLFNNKIAVM